MHQPILSSSSAEYIPQKSGMRGIWEKIEQAARVCYKSEGKIQYDENGNSLTAEAFANKIINVRKHTSVAEHAAVYLKMPKMSSDGLYWTTFTLPNTAPYSKIVDNLYDVYITTNYRVIIENHLEEYMKYMIDPVPGLHILRHTFHVFTDRGVSAELNRHRHNSPSERSTRYVDQQEGISVCWPENISKENINRGMSEWEMNMSPEEVLYMANQFAGYFYQKLRNLGWSKQEARRVLPLDIQTELFISAFEDDWEHFFDLRYLEKTGKVHPDMKELTTKMLECLPSDSYLKNKYYADKSIH